MAVASAISLLTLFLMPNTPSRLPRTQIDWLDGILLGSGLAGIVYGIGNGSDWGWSSTRTLAFVIVGILAALLFLWVEGKVASPMFPLTLLGRRRVWSTLVFTTVIALIVSLGTGMVVALIPLMILESVSVEE